MESNALTVIHKLVRHEIYAVANRLASAGDSDDAGLLDAVRRAAGMLRGHAEQEDARLLPVLQAMAPELARRLDEQHEQLDREMDAICAAAESLQRLPMSRRAHARQQLHDAWNRFVAGCLLHMDEEERAMQPLLGDRIALCRVAESTLAMEQATADEFLANLWRVITPQERIAIERARLRLQLERIAHRAGTADTPTADAA
ncbi:hemerythrin domain-containing protein [Marilutibacter chinensis]|uniref:Hemerythrin domain-containing protein n=1 Tax=Marilutibacter chinensis TaxID=2912247 RepID=A0ABS9HVB9_9GAMM|nr:hemerythrin domain-containing protein [Lysobacter chinensis]MCF7222258.1 hemerythrin domain-containing protein [Lysobacter chinensis]